MLVIPIMMMLCFAGTAWSQTTYNIQLGTTYSETVKSGSYNRYSFSVKKEGMLTVNISTDGSAAALPYQGATFRLLNSKGETLKTFITPAGFPYSDDYSITSIGDYQIEIASEFGGTFKMRVDCFVDETEPNNTISTAMSLPNSGCTVRGTLTSSDVDMYKYVLTQPGRFTVNASLGSSSDGGVRCVDVKWYSSDGTLIYYRDAITTYNDYMDLEAGTYSISITPRTIRNCHCVFTAFYTEKATEPKLLKNGTRHSRSRKSEKILIRTIAYQMHKQVPRVWAE
jgi:hypothetical protein